MKFSYKKIFLILGWCISIGMVSVAQVNIVPSSLQSCMGGTNVPLPNIILSESQLGDFGTTSGSATVILSLVGANFNFSSGNLLVGSTGTSDIAASSISVGGNTITLNLTVTNTGVLDQLTISGVQVNFGGGAGSTAFLTRSASNPGSASVNGGLGTYATIAGITVPISGSIGFPGFQCASNATAVTATGFTGATSYIWGIVSGPGTISGTNAVAPINVGSSNVTVSVIGVNGICQSNSASQLISITPLPSGGSLTPVAPFCGAGSVQLTVSGVSNATNYQWGVVSGPGTLSGGFTNVTLTFGNSSVVVSVAGINTSCLGPTLTQTVTVSSGPPTGSFVPQGVLCGSGSATLSVTGFTGATGYSWGITSGSGSLSAAGLGTQTFTFSSAGLTTVTVQGSVGSCTSGTISTTLTVNSLPTGGSLSTQGLCSNSTTVVTVSGVSNATSYVWGIVSGPGNIQGNTSLANLTVGASNIQVSVAGINGVCQGATISNTYSVTTSPTPPGLTSSNSRCGAGSVTLAVFGGSGSSYNWYTTSVGGLLVGNSSNLFNTPSISTTTSFYASSFGSGCESTRILAVASVLGSLAPPTGNNVTRCVGQPIIPLTVNGINVNWYRDPALSTQVASNVNTYSIPGLSSGMATVLSFYVTQSNGSCQSGVASITYTNSDTTQLSLQGVGDYVCKNLANSFTVTGFPAGGFFINVNSAFTTTTSGSAVVINPGNFPSTLTSINLNYRYVNSAGCVSNLVQNVNVVSPTVPTIFNPKNSSDIITGNYAINLSTPELNNPIYSGPENLILNNQLIPNTSILGVFREITVNGVDLNGCQSKGIVNYKFVDQPSNLFVYKSSLSVLGTSFCQGSTAIDFLFNLDLATVPGQKAYPTSFSAITPVSISGTGVPDPSFVDVTSLVGISYNGFSNSNLATSVGLYTNGVTKYYEGKFDPRIAGANVIDFSYDETTPIYVWDPIRTNKFGFVIGGTNKFQYQGSSTTTRTYKSPVISVTNNAPPSFNLPTLSNQRCTNSPLFNLSPSISSITFSWTSTGTGLGPNQPTGFINGSAPFYLNPSVAGIKGGIYLITAAVNNGACSSSSQQWLTISDTTIVDLSTLTGSQFYGGIPTTYCKDTREYPLDNFVTVSGGFNQGIYEFKTIDAVKSSGSGYTFDANSAKTGNNIVSFAFTNTTTGCTSRKSTTVRVDSAAFVRMPVLPPVCAGIRFNFTGTVGGVNPSYSTIAGHTWTSKFSSPGAFGTQTILGGRVINNYLPTQTDTVNQQVWLVLTSAPTGNSCPQVSDSVLVNINPNAQLFTKPFSQFCASDPILMTATLSGSASSATWIITQPGFTYNKLIPTVSNGETIQIFPSAAFLNAGGTIAPAILSTSGVGACTSKSVSSIIQIDQRPRVTVGFVTPVSSATGNNLLANSCARNSIQVFANVTAGRVAGLPPQVAGGVWRTSGSGTFAGSSANTTGNTSDTYIPSLADTTSGKVQLIFTTSVLGSSFCSAATDTITIYFYRPPVAKATVVNGNVCGNASINLIGTIRTGARIFGNLADGVVFDQWQKIVEGANVLDTNYQYTPNRATGAASYTPNIFEASQGATLRFVMTTGIPNSGVCPLVRDTVRVFVSQPAQMTIIRDTTSYCAYKNGYVNLKASFSGSTPSATWTSGGRSILPATWVTSVSGLNTPLVSSYYPSVQEARTGPDITFVLTSGKPVKSPNGSPLGTLNTCPIIRDSIRLSIKKLPTLRIVDLATSYCNTGDYIINTIPSVGEPGILPAVLTGPGISGNKFTPADAVSAISTIGGIGRIPITLMYRNGDGCYKDTTQYTVVNPLPKVDFTVSTICSGADTVLLYGKGNQFGGINTFVVNTNTINGVALRDSISTWKWDVSPIQVVRLNRGDSIPTAKLRLADPGSQSITLTVKSLQGCVNSANRNITFYPYPKVEFTAKGQCLTDTAIFVDKSTTNSSSYNIGTWVWDFGDGFVTSSGAGIIPNGTHGGNTKGSYTIPKHYYSSPGQYNVKLSLTTFQSNCSRKDSAIFNVLPRIKVGPQAPYQQSFAQDNGYFVAAGQNSSWTFGAPNKQKTKVNAGEKAWFTGKDTSYNANENSWVECPCFDFSDMKKPMVSMDFLSLMDTLAGDGAMLIYTTDTNEVWKTLGAVDNKGLNWYNRINLSNSQPGDKAGLASKGITYPGWGGFNSNWTTARYILDQLAGQKKVRFRVVFGATSNPKEKIYEGFAFKNFIIKERSKVVLLEHFTNAADFTKLPTAGLSNIIPAIDDSTVAVINRLNRSNTAVNVLPIFYHTNFPGSDPVNALNPTPVSARSLYYGISSVPRTVLDGSYFKGSSYTQSGGWNEQTITKRALEDPAFAIQFDVVTTTSNVTATAEITALRDLPSSIYLFQMAAIENLLSVPGIVGGNGQTNFYYSLRRYLPNQDGTTYPNKSWTKGEKTTVSQTWTYTPSEKPFDPAQIGVVGFMQNFTSQEVFQVGYKVPGLAANITKEPLEEKLSASQVIIYPNPGNDVVFVKGDLTWAGGKISVVDALGQLVYAGEISPEGNAALATQDWKSGVYQVVIVDALKGVTYKQKVIIQH